MRMFWAVLGVLMLASAAYLMVSPRKPTHQAGDVTAPVPSGRAESAVAAPPGPPQHEPSPGAASQRDQPAATPPPPDGPAQAVPAPQVIAIPETRATPAAPESNPPAPAEAAATPDSTPRPDPASAASSAPVLAAEPKPATTPNNEPESKPPVAPEALPPPSAGPQAPPAGSEPHPRLDAQPDGSVLVDGKYRMSGSGTEADPYKVTWDHLVSAQADYSPKDGRKSIPPRIRMLNGKWVSITGNIAFPLMAESSDECLSMLNQWDGCCIGIQPTPYDAIEVRLREPATGNARLTTFGTIKGRMKVEPNLVGGWLTGLYVMDRGTLTPQAYGGFAP
jgi:hypothetical protein